MLEEWVSRNILKIDKTGKVFMCRHSLRYVQAVKGLAEQQCHSTETES